VAPVVVVFVLPIADHHAGLGQGPQDVETLVADAGVKRLDTRAGPAG
jgi:hypothetical protein